MWKTIGKIAGKLAVNVAFTIASYAISVKVIEGINKLTGNEKEKKQIKAEGTVK